MNPTHSTPLVLSLRPAGRLAALLAGAGLLLIGCSGSLEVDQETNQVLLEHLGEACTTSPLAAGSEVIVEGTKSCGAGSCVSCGEEACAEHQRGPLCTCRCSGAGEGPFCSCSEGYECVELIEDLGLQDREVAGGYCLPAP